MGLAEGIQSLALLAYILVCVGGLSFLLVRFRRRADDLSIRARSPTLATFPAVYAIVVGAFLIPMQQLVQLHGVHYPCPLSLLQSWFFIPLWGAPFALRSLRVIIATDKGRQEKFGIFLRKRTTLAMEGFLCVVAACIVITLSQVQGPYSGEMKLGGPRGGECFMMMEWKVLLPFCVLQTVIFGVLGYWLRNVNDLLNISSELRLNFILYMLFGLPYFVVQLHYRYLTDEAVPTKLQFLISAMVVLAMLNTMWASIGGLEIVMDCFGLELTDTDGGSTHGPSSNSGGSLAGGSRHGALASPQLLANVTDSDVRRWKRHYNDVPSIMRNERVSAVFGALANRFLCNESYEFLVAVSDYKGSAGVGAGPCLQHLLYNDICKAFVVVNSEQEINITADQRDEVLRYEDYRIFLQLDERARRSVFRCAEDEVSDMLQINLVTTFHNSADFKETCAAVDVEEHVWQLEEEKFLVTDNHLTGNVEHRTHAGNGDGVEGEINLLPINSGDMNHGGAGCVIPGEGKSDGRPPSGFLALLGFSSSVAPRR